MANTENPTLVIDPEPQLDQSQDQQPTLAQPTLAQPTLAQPTLQHPAPQQPVLPQPTLQQPAATQPVRTDGAFAITSFVLGILSILSGWTLIAPVVGLVFGILALRRRTAERTLALWGVWLNGAMLVLTVIVGMVMIAAVGFGFLASLPYVN